MADYKKDLLGYEDISVDAGGIEESFSRNTSTGGTQSIKKIQAKLIPILLALRTVALYDTDTMDGATNVNDALNNIATSLASVHKFANEAILDQVLSAGSGAIISVAERAKLNAIVNTGSGRIITDEERAKLEALINLTEEQLETLSNLNDLLDRLENLSGNKVAYISDVKSYNTLGAGAGASGHHVRELNTLEDPEDVVTLLLSNQFTLAPGIYDLHVETVSYATNEGFSYIYNVTNSSVVFQSNTVTPFFSPANQANYSFFGTIDITVESKFELKTYVTYAATANEFGAAHMVSGYNNIYSKIKIEQKMLRAVAA